MMQEKKVAKRKKLKFNELPIFPESIDRLPSPAEYNGRRMRWVGIGWVDEGPADGTEPLLITDDKNEVDATN
jgi:hypothetical protein